MQLDVVDEKKECHHDKKNESYDLFSLKFSSENFKISPKTQSENEELKPRRTFGFLNSQITWMRSTTVGTFPVLNSVSPDQTK